jgi:DtxR family transcriptional regulator, Mn-dependent transcriptional regulator
MIENLTQPIEDYLKTIYQITREQPRASTNQIAEALKITPASVTGMVKKLSETNPPLLKYQRHHGVELTEQGELVALEILRHHRLLEMFLHQILGYDWDEVHVEADRLEHFISEKFEERISQALGDPSHDPHGDPIPDRQLSMPESPHLLLTDLHPNQSAIVRRVNSSDGELLRYLAEQGLTPGAHIQAVAFSSFDDNLTLHVEGRDEKVVLGPSITRHIYIELT